MSHRRPGAPGIRRGSHATPRPVPRGRVAAVPRDGPWRRPAAGTALLLALGLLAGCGGDAPPRAGAPPGFSADTASPGGLLAGATATEAGCRAMGDAVWAAAGKRRECIRFAAAGLDDAPPPRNAVIYLPGDPAGAAYRTMGGLPQVEGVGEAYGSSPEGRRAGAEALSAALGGVPIVVLGRPGMHGSSGSHARDRHTRAEVALVDDALTQLQGRLGLGKLVLVGFSSGGTIAANLLARRADLRCAVIASAPLDLAAYYAARRGGPAPAEDGAALLRGRDLADPMRSLPAVKSGATVFVLGDRGDRAVPAYAWDRWVAAARRAGLDVHAAEVAGRDRAEPGGVARRHDTAVAALAAGRACADGLASEAILAALARGEPAPAPP